MAVLLRQFPVNPFHRTVFYGNIAVFAYIQLISVLGIDDVCVINLHVNLPPSYGCSFLHSLMIRSLQLL